MIIAFIIWGLALVGAAVLLYEMTHPKRWVIERKSRYPSLHGPLDWTQSRGPYRSEGWARFMRWRIRVDIDARVDHDWRVRDMQSEGRWR